MKLALRTIYDVMIQDVGFHVLTTVSIILIITSFFIPPLGIIDPSVFVGVGELFAFAGLWELHVAVRKGMDAKIKHHDTSFTVSSKKKEESEENENDSETEEE
jgi:hypothetical protein